MKNINKKLKINMRKFLWYLITILIIIVLAKNVFPDWSSIAIFGGLMVIWGYFLRGIIDECHKKGNKETKTSSWGE